MTNRPYKQHIADIAAILKKEAIQNIIICPGSRSAPLIQVFERDSYFHCHSIVDERSAAYVGLGMSKEIQAPVVIVTTSGTASLNLAPAVAEAFFQRIPLIILTADRDPEWPPQFSNQRINQNRIFEQNAKHFMKMPMEIAGEEKMEDALQDFAAMIKSAKTPKKGPVHINIPLQEPLYEKIGEASGIDYTNADKDFSQEPPMYLSENDRKLILEALVEGKKVLLIAGIRDYSEEEKELLQNVIDKYQLCLITENLSNLKHESFVSAPELALGNKNMAEDHPLEPEIVISFGGQIVSKKTRLFIQKRKGIQVFETPNFPIKLLRSLNEDAKDRGPVENRYKDDWLKAESRAWEKAKNFLNSSSFSNISATAAVIDKLPAGSKLHLANSGSVRYSQLFPARKDVYYYANRGTSGIDGSFSSAVGAAMLSPDQHVFITGDLSFVYDSNAMWNRSFPKNLKIVVLNDHGGGIFRLLDGPDKMPFFEDYSVAHHPVSLEQLTKAFGLEYQHAGSEEELNNVLAGLFNITDKPVVLEVETYESENSTIFKSFYKQIQE